MADKHVADKESQFVAVCIIPDYCQVGKDIIPFTSFRKLDNMKCYAKTVFARGHRNVLTVDSIIKSVDGDAGKGINSGTSLSRGDCEVISGSSTVRVEGKLLARHLDLVRMNNRNTIGRLYTMQSAPSSMTCSKSDTAPNNEPSGSMSAWEPSIGDHLDKLMSDWRQGKLGEGALSEASRVVQETGASWKESFKTVWDALPFTADEAATAAARQRIADGAMGTVEGLATLMGPPKEAVYGAHLNGNPEWIAAVEEMQAKQSAAIGAIKDSAKKSVGDAYDRSGVSGVIGMAAATVGMEALGGKGVGAALKVTEKIGDIVKLAKTPAEAVAKLDEAVEAAKAAKASAKNADEIAKLDDEIAQLEKARDEQKQLAEASGKDGVKIVPKKGTVVIEKGAKPNANEERAGKGLADEGYDVTFQKTANDAGISGVQTADMRVEGVGQVDVYSPLPNTRQDSIVNTIVGKHRQANSILTQTDLPYNEVVTIKNRVFGNLGAKEITTLFFQDSKNNIIRFDKGL
jgi:hypothetical protein